MPVTPRVSPDRSRSGTRAAIGRFPVASIRYCLETVGIFLEEVDQIAYGWMNLPGLLWDRFSTFAANRLMFTVHHAPV